MNRRWIAIIVYILISELMEIYSMLEFHGSPKTVFGIYFGREGIWNMVDWATVVSAGVLFGAFINA